MYKRSKKDSLGASFIDLILIIVIFSVGWSLSTMFSKLIFPSEGFGKVLNLNAISLILLSIVEFIFYRLYYKDFFSSNGKEK